jgi:hypothetical protein
MIQSCDKCGGLYATEAGEMFGGTPCICDRSTPTHKNLFCGMSIRFNPDPKTGNPGEVFTQSGDGSWTSNLREGKFKQVFVPINFGHARIVIPGEL